MLEEEEPEPEPEEEQGDPTSNESLLETFYGSDHGPRILRSFVASLRAQAAAGAEFSREETELLRERRAHLVTMASETPGHPSFVNFLLGLAEDEAARSGATESAPRGTQLRRDRDGRQGRGLQGGAAAQARCCLSLSFSLGFLFLRRVFPLAFFFPPRAHGSHPPAPISTTAYSINASTDLLPTPTLSALYV